MRIGKTIGGKLSWGFGGILAGVCVLAALDLLAVGYEQSTRDTYKRAIDMSRQMSEGKHTIRNKDLHLRNLVLKDTNEATLLPHGKNALNQVITKTRATVA